MAFVGNLRVPYVGQKVWSDLPELSRCGRLNGVRFRAAVGGRGVKQPAVACNGEGMAEQIHLISKAEDIQWMREPVLLRGKVQRGFGRGSRKLGTPTANLPGILVDGKVSTARDGVYIGFGFVPSLMTAPVEMVANIGHNITFDDVTERVVEAYLMDDTLAEEFYGAEMRLCIGGFLRPEYKFNSMDALVANIRNDIAVTATLLSTPQAKRLSRFPPLLVA
jgi:riboflavin kinase